MGKSVSFKLAFSSSSLLLLVLLTVTVACMARPGESRTSPSVKADQGNLEDANITGFLLPSTCKTDNGCGGCQDYCRSKSPGFSYQCNVKDGWCCCSDL
ncbi:unnamed protein product [Linum trigynum]|uniref:Uncharacterized protein n=1 Tax=Linum trigynum TaxID=586398 RepID=A0AAV2G1X7_9ROSI